MNTNNLLFLIALVVGLGVAYIAVDQAYSTGNAFWGSRPTCFDSDKGLNYSVAGYVQYAASKKFDYCANNTLFEGWCSTRGGPTFARYQCPNGYSCNKGACVPGPKDLGGGTSVSSQVTYRDGDAYIGQSAGDPDWIWDFADFNTPNPKIGVENDFVWNDPTDKPVGVGQCIKIPNDYIKVCLESLNNDYSKTTYTFELDKNADLSEANAGTSTSVPALYLHSSSPSAFTIFSSNLESNNTYPGLTDKVWFWRCMKDLSNSSWLGVYYEDVNGKTQMAGCLNMASLTSGIDYKLLISLGKDMMLWVAKKGTNQLELKLSSRMGNNDDLKMLWSYQSNGFDFLSLGSTPSLGEATELSWYGYNDTTDGWTGSDGYISVNIGAFDLDQRTRFGTIIRNPKIHGASDEVVLDIPSKQVEAVIAVSGAFNNRFNVPLGVPISNRSLVYSKYTPLVYSKTSSSISFGSNSFTPIEMLEIGKTYSTSYKFVKTVTSLTSGNKDYQTGVFLEVDVDALKYYQTLPTDLTKASAINPLKIKFLGKELTITSVDTSNPSSPKIVTGSGCGEESKVVSGGDTCCSGLSKISNSYYYGTECKTNNDEYICTAKCGDGSCSGWESYCNCPQDCTPISEIGLGLSVGQNISLRDKNLVLVSVDSSGNNVTVRVNDVWGVIEKGSTEEVNGLLVKVISTSNVADPSKGSGLFYLKIASSTPTPINQTQTNQTQSCSDTCSTNGSKQCSGTGYQVCGNYDSDSCLEWSSVTSCSFGYTCSSGQCAANNTQSCTDQCSSSWQSCTSNATASWYAPCGNFDSDSCLEWGPVNYCPTGSTCSCQNSICSCQIIQTNQTT